MAAYAGITPMGGTTAVRGLLFIRGKENAIEIEATGNPLNYLADDESLFDSVGRNYDPKSGRRRAVPLGRHFSPELARLATDGRFFVSVSTRITPIPGGFGFSTCSLIDLRTEKAIGSTKVAYSDLRHVPDRKTFVVLSWPCPRHIPTPDAPLDPEVAQLFAEVVTCQELDPAGSMRHLDEAEWEERRGKLAERLREHPAPFVVGRIAADPWYWLRRKLDGAKTDKERLKYLDRLIAVEPTWKNYEQRAQVHYFGYYPWDDSNEHRKVPDEATSRKMAAEAARDFLEAGKRAGAGYWHRVRDASNNEVGKRLFRLAWELARSDKLTPGQYELGFRLAEALYLANPEDRDRRQHFAIANYRLGRYAEALPLLPQRDWERHCISEFGRLFLSPWNAALVEKEVDVKDPTVLEAMAYLAMTYHRLGHPDQARAVLAHLRTLVVWNNFTIRHFSTIGEWYSDLLREAEALIEGQPGK